jgi:hypothetical protein
MDGIPSGILATAFNYWNSQIGTSCEAPGSGKCTDVLGQLDPQSKAGMNRAFGASLRGASLPKPPLTSDASIRRRDTGGD